MQNKEIFSVAVKLFVITAMLALCLAAINRITEPVIMANNKKIELSAQQELLPEAKEFVAGEKPELVIPGIEINSISAGIDKNDGSICGYVAVVTSSEAYDGDIKVMVGVGKDMKVTRVKILESSETAGLGQNASKPEFLDQFKGAYGTLSVVKGIAKENEVSAIASATITSKAVTSCVNAALAAAEEKSSLNKLEETAKKFEEIKQETNAQISDSKEVAE